MNHYIEMEHLIGLLFLLGLILIVILWHWIKRFLINMGHSIKEFFNEGDEQIPHSIHGDYTDQPSKTINHHDGDLMEP